MASVSARWRPPSIEETGETWPDMWHEVESIGAVVDAGEGSALLSSLVGLWRARSDCLVVGGSPCRGR